MTERRKRTGAGPGETQRTQAKIDAINSLAWELRHSRSDRAMTLSQKAYQLSTTGKLAKQPYRQGQAASLLTQGFLNQQQGKLDVALSQCFEASTLLESLPATRVNVDTYRIISWVNFFLGNSSNAMSYGLKALHLAQELKLKIQEASVLDELGDPLHVRRRPAASRPEPGEGIGNRP